MEISFVSDWQLVIGLARRRRYSRACRLTVRLGTDHVFHCGDEGVEESGRARREGRCFGSEKRRAPALIG